MQYNLYFPLLGLLTIPFFPLKLSALPSMFVSFELFPFSSALSTTNNMIMSTSKQTNITDWLTDFHLSVNRETPSVFYLLFCILWISGILIMMIFFFQSKIHLHQLKTSALPLQNANVHQLYQHCLEELQIKKNIPIYSTAYISSPILAGCFKPRIYLPISLISDYNAQSMRYMLLHELQHYKHKDNLTNDWMNLAMMVYWFNPLVRYALCKMRNDREIACDTSVLALLSKDCYTEYGYTLINFAEKISSSSFPFTTGISGTMKQMKQRIMNIAAYQKPSSAKKVKGSLLFTLISLMLLCFTPLLSAYATTNDYYPFENHNNISYVDFSEYFKHYDGCFVLYNLEHDSWQISNKEFSTLRVSPDSTYKIYSALFGLDAKIITPEHSMLTWDNTIYPFATWNTDQDLNSAMKNSVNWYFQSIDKQVGANTIKRQLHQIRYGNEQLSNDLASYWLESSLKISPVEQVELLQKLYNHQLSFSPEHIQAVKDALYLSSSSNGKLYGKTGTGCVNNADVNGWFIGYVECTNHTYFFATNIQAKSDATGYKASEITLSILDKLNIWSKAN